MKTLSVLVGLLLVGLVISQTIYVGPGSSSATYRVWTDGGGSTVYLLQSGTIATSAISPVTVTSSTATSNGSTIYIGDSNGTVHIFTRTSASTPYAEVGTVRVSTNNSVSRVEVINSTAVRTYSNGTVDTWTISGDTLVLNATTPIWPSSADCLASSVQVGAWTWNGAKCVVNCSRIDNALTGVLDNTCSCAAGYWWNGVACVPAVGFSCGLIVNTVNSTFNATLGGCNCRSGYSWDGGACQINCNVILNALAATTNVSDCTCKATYTWSTTTSTCVAAGCNGTSNCSCLQYWNASQNACVVNCSAVQYSTGASNGTNSCACNSNYYWNNGACYINCSNISFTNGSSSSDTGACNCQSGYTWNSTARICSAYNCSAINNSNGQDGSTACKCKTGYVWSNGKCWLNCSILNNTNGNLTDTTCRCVVGYSWNATILACVINTTNTIDCNTVTNATGQYNETQCVCTSNFYFNTTSKQCIINCTAISMNSGAGNTTWSCNCQTGYYWNNSQADCWKDCTNVDYANGTDPKNVTSCQCRFNFDLNDQGDCVLNCAKTPYSKDEKHRNGSCKCHGGYRWDKHIYFCVSKSSSSAGVAVGVSLGVTFGVLALAAFLYYWFYYRKRNQQGAIPVPPPQPEPILTTTTMVSETRIQPLRGSGAPVVMDTYTSPGMRGSMAGPPVPPPFLRASIANQNRFPPSSDFRGSGVVVGPNPMMGSNVSGQGMPAAYRPG